MYLGLDIGYSSLKIAYGPKGQRPQTLTLPVGAAPVDSAHNGYFRNQDGVSVVVDGEPWMACAQPLMLGNGSRVLDEHYTQSSRYRALYHAALKLTGAQRIERVATGLPVRQYFNQALRSRLVDMLKGRHQVDAEHTVEVCDAAVYPQPAGMYVAFLTGRPGGADEMNNQTVLVIDPGFYSVDSVIIRHNRPYPDAVSTSTQAMSRVLELADAAITAEFCDDTAMPGRFKGTLEERLREGRMDIRCGARLTDARPYLERAAAIAGKHALEEVVSSLRNTSFNIDVVLIAGGGASFYAPAVHRVFRQQRVMVMRDAPTANAHGFWVFAGGGV